MAKNSSPSLPHNGRLISAGLTAAAAIGLVVNHFLIESQHVGRLMILCLGPIAFFLGLGGMVEPKIVWSVGKYGKDLPAIYKVIGGALGTVGLAVTGLLLLFVYQFGPPAPKPAPARTGPAATAARIRTQASATRQRVSTVNPKPVAPAPVDAAPVPTAKPARRIVPHEVQHLTYDRPNKRWVPMDEAALKGVSREDQEGVTTLHYVDGAHALLKVLWPNVMEVGDRFTVELRGANSFEVVDLDGADANARISIPPSDSFTVVEVHREPDRITFTCDGQPLKPYYASGKLRGDEARAALVGTTLRATFTVKKGAQASFRNAQILRP